MRHRAGRRLPGGRARIADLTSSGFNPDGKIPMITSVAGDTLFCNGSSSTPVSVSPGNLGGASVQRRDDGVCGAAGDGAGAAKLQLRAESGAGG